MASPKRIRTILCFVWLLLFLSITRLNFADSPHFPGSITDFRGRALDTTRPVRRIVCLIESALSGLYMLGVEDRIVGVSTNVYHDTGVNAFYAVLDPRIGDRRLPAPGNWDFINIEMVISLKPDLVIIWAHQSEAISALEERDIPVYGVFISRFEDIYREIENLGQLTGTEARARSLVEYTTEEVARFSQKTCGNRDAIPPSVYFMWAQGDLDTSGGPSTVNELIHIAGGRNVCGHISQEHLTVNIENLIQWSPEVIVMWTNPGRSPQEVIDQPAWKSIRAVQHGRVHELPGVFYCDLWTLKFQFAVKQVAAWCHPGLFPDIDLRGEGRAMMQFLYGRAAAERMPVVP